MKQKPKHLPDTLLTKLINILHSCLMSLLVLTACQAL